MLGQCWHDSCKTRVYLLSVYAQVVKYSDGLKSQKYICWTRKQMRYILGDHGVSYVTGFPAKKGSPSRVYDRGASCPSPPQNCSAITALYNPAPNPHTLSGALVMVRSFSWHIHLPVPVSVPHVL